ncbi:uncharacterized protein BP5553_08423 [Venustampulla echinocandica]|uniref:chitinase n=1 Tax=Venustampulla echinocandica TaxID=2656787 RepID=A0A370TE64_9HELO|nr:uncharacterized protein BP5553_08423 [Venustampulla echinocandica]RDL32984.1 hypothetical protein BP5553_08423 [Venustampulla echinocandica]
MSFTTTSSTRLKYPAKLTFALLLWLGVFSNAVNTSSVPLRGEDPCPVSCAVSGSKPGNWTAYSSVDRLDFCHDTMLLDFAVYTPLGGPTKHTTTIRACTQTQSKSSPKRALRRRKSLSDRGTEATNPTTAAVQVAWWNSNSAQNADISNIVDETRKVQEYLTANADTSLVFASNKNEAIGVFAGALVKDTILKSTAVQDFITHVNDKGVSQSLLLQVCGSDLKADFTFGIVAATGDSKLELVQSAVASWANGSCLAGGDGTDSLKDINIPVPTKIDVRSPAPVRPRDLCRTTTVTSGDSCQSLATACGTTLADFQQYNPGSSFCSTLQVDQIVCCTSGSLPVPTQNPDGSCASYVVQSGDWCAKIAAANAVTVDNLETWNQNTWGWTGCGNLQPKVNICLSTGTPPMPAPVPSYICGPQVPGTSPPPSGVSLASLNPCPLKACCDVWGQCGTTPEFCTPSGTGPPGTAAPGTNGCISNCGTDIVSGTAPASFMSVAYFEGWNPSRPCVHMDVDQIDATKYTHIHFGFAGLTADTYQVNIPSDVQAQFDRFTTFQTPMKKVLSLGGWTLSASPFDNQVFRSGMSPQNREATSTNIANFITENNLDGVDIDWEYPGDPDNAQSSPSDGPNYLKFITVLKGKLPGKTVSIAAPASYYYLKGFPIAAMSKTIDYIVFMAYDLHGQWDYGHEYSQDGCPGGNCLRSHVNITETLDALAMITKAGVESSKVLVGVSSYGRSFEMTIPGCRGPTCTYTGPNSGATPGNCTQTAGYLSNAEIGTIIGSGTSGVRQLYDGGSDSDILLYPTNQWVGYMSDKTKASRIERYKGLNFGGTSDWAVDLQQVPASP